MVGEMSAVIEFESLAAALAAYETPVYQEMLRLPNLTLMSPCHSSKKGITLVTDQLSSRHLHQVCFLQRLA